jgi:hypothetical protein
MKQMFNDSQLRRAIQLGVILIVGSCLISQVMMQLGGGARDERVDLTDQAPDGFEDEGFIFEDGFPPFISSAGAFMPERIVFNFGLFTGGILMILLSFEVFHRSKPEGTKRNVANVTALITGIIIGFSMVQLVGHPFNTSLIMHIFWAMNIFWGAQLWIATLTYARGELDADIRWRGWTINRVRWCLFAVAIFSFQAMTALVATGHLVESAILEWTLTFSAEAMILTLIPALTPSA